MRPSRTTTIALTIIAVILLGLFLHHEVMMAEVGSLVDEESSLSRGPEVWSDPQDGVRVTMRIMGLREIQYSSGNFVIGPFGTHFIGPGFCSYPRPGTKPHLLLEARARNVSDRTVYLIGDKTRSGVEGPVYLQICLKEAHEISEPFKLHPLPFERQQAEEMKPGRELFFLEYIPYEDLSFHLGGDIVGMVSIVHAEPPHGSHVAPDAVAYSEPVQIPSHLFQHYFNIIWK